MRAQSASDLATAAKRYPGIDPKNTYYQPPPVNEADYRSYFKDGSSELVIRPVFKLADGTTTLCRRQPFEVAYLYPRTEYTIWLIENWIFQLQKAGRNSAFTDYPGMYVKGLPSYLYDGSRVNVVRDTACDANHEYVFHNVPIGRYVLFLYHVNWISEVHERFNTQQIMTPDGPHNEVAPGGIEDASHVTDSYVDYSRGAVVVDKPDYRFTLDADYFETVVHYTESYND